MFSQAPFFMAAMEKLLCNLKSLSASVPFSAKRRRGTVPCLRPLSLPVTDADLSCWGQDSCRYKENRINTSYFAIYRLEESSGYGSETL
jgi:hypothetical protein